MYNNLTAQYDMAEDIHVHHAYSTHWRDCMHHSLANLKCSEDIHFLASQTTNMHKLVQSLEEDGEFDKKAREPTHVGKHSAEKERG